MNTHADKTQENKSQAVSAVDSQMQSSGESSFQFVDNRPEAVAQRKLQEIANNSPQVSQLRAFQDMVNNSPQAKHTAQLQAIADNHSAQQRQPIQKKENNTGLPDSLKTGMENLSGMSLDDVKVHRNSDKPAQLQAHAYAQGTDIHLGSGQEKHLPHETWHVVQQKQGRVKPTMQMKGKVNINDDARLEKEADVMGAKALHQQSVSPFSLQFKTSSMNESGTLQEMANNSPQVSRLRTFQAMASRTPLAQGAVVQRNLILPAPVPSGVLRYNNREHGEAQMSRIAAQHQLTGEWQRYLFENDDYVWDVQAEAWVKADPQTSRDTDDAYAEVLESTEQLILAGAAAGSAATTLGAYGMELGAAGGESLASSWGFPTLGSWVGGAVGAGVGGTVGALGGGALSLNPGAVAKAKVSEVLWKAGILTQGIEIDLGVWDLAKFIAGTEVTITPKLDSITKSLQHEGSSVILSNLQSEMKLTWTKATELRCEMPKLTTAINVVLPAPASGNPLLEGQGNADIRGLKLGAKTIDASLLGMLFRLIRDKAQTEADVIAAMEANFECESVTLGMTVFTHAVEGAKGRAEDLGEDKFSASLSVQELSLENQHASLKDTFGSLGQLEAQATRDGGKKGAKASVNAYGTFRDLPALNDMIKKLDTNVSGLRPGMNSIVGSIAGSKIRKGISKALDQSPGPHLTDEVYEVVKANSGSINVDDILAKLSGNPTKQHVKDCCAWLIKKGRLKVSNPKWATIPSKKKKYEPSKPLREMVKGTGKMKGQAASSVVSSVISSSGLNVNMSGASRGETGQAHGSMQVEAHMDKELVAKAYKFLELANTVFSVM